MRRTANAIASDHLSSRPGSSRVSASRTWRCACRNLGLTACAWTVSSDKRGIRHQHNATTGNAEMTVNRRFVFGVDLDGVCADFYRGLRPIAAEWLGVDVSTLPERVSWGLPEWGIDKAPGGYEALHRFAVTQRDLFRVLPPMSGAPRALRRLSAADVRIRIITHRFLSSFSIRWLLGKQLSGWIIMTFHTGICASCRRKRQSAQICTWRTHRGM